MIFIQLFPSLAESRSFFVIKYLLLLVLPPVPKRLWIIAAR